MAHYKDKTINPRQALAERIERIESFGYVTAREVGVTQLTMETPEGNKEYELHRYDYQPKGGDPIKRGNAVGYVALEDGHVEVQGICVEASQLDETLPVLSAIRLER